ncbi:MAG TPA: stress response translation initiation inhibitor YciH [Candidatus Thermoplasmatota archaeon]|nr:stress response translation initiation inhibitor YciH [Candidatus Thermoplasmatota archaeon]
MICETCGLPKEICVCEDIAREQQEIRITADARRYGKLMTIVDGIQDSSISLDNLLSTLKSKCACGGTIKEGRIELQGDHRKKVQKVLEEMGFQAKLD